MHSKNNHVHQLTQCRGVYTQYWAKNSYGVLNSFDVCWYGNVQVTNDLMTQGIGYIEDGLLLSLPPRRDLVP